MKVQLKYMYRYISFQKSERQP